MTEREQLIRERLASILVDVSFSTIERRIVAKLADGERHLGIELLPLVGDPQATIENLQRHVSGIRPKVARFDLAILCEFANRQKFYRLVFLLDSLLD